MEPILITIVLAFIFGTGTYFVYHAYKREMESAKCSKERLLTVSEENAYLRKRLSEIVDILNSSEGGISKRLGESMEITETIHRLTPEVFQKDFGLVYWLHANDQFLVRLAGVTRDLIDRYKSEAIEVSLARDRAALFTQVYATAGMPNPISFHDK